MNVVAEPKLEKDASVADLLLRYPGALEVFKKNNIDFCCQGHRSLQDACLQTGLNPEAILERIAASQPEVGQEVFRVMEWSSSFLADFIVQNHHAYVRHTIPEIQELLEKVCEVHGKEAPELIAIQTNFNTLAAELLSHMDKEENILFSAIKHMETIHGNQPQISNIMAPIMVMASEHESAGKLIKEIYRLSNHYTPPAYACPTFKLAYKRLEEFESDLMMHIHLENNVLFKRMK